jgi:hypothetical protein
MCVKWKIILVSFEIVLISMHDRCLICAECAIGSELLGDMGQVEACFGLLGDGVNLDVR